MIPRRLYYHLKPYLPWRLRMGVRRFMAARRLRKCADTWPINEAIAQPPANWPGWPDGKQFALILTHDVEGPVGVAKCRKLMELERGLGFRSSFNFIPEGDYRVPRELREELTRNGFEVGVHDLRHDGKLYWGRREFYENAQVINRYLAEWGACGFRSGFMLHNLEWLQALNIQYDASTFDTDPFEPQPDGADTIFPFWVPGASGGGYLELPYTLPQDSTLFFVLNESSPAIWKRKLDWLVEHGGMALINVHPDYLAFGPGAKGRAEFPEAHYRELLEYAKRKYAGRFWHALPRELAEYCSATRPIKPVISQRRVCVVTYSVYQSDNRVIRCAEALADRGDKVDVFSLKRNDSSPETETFGNVQVHRVLKRSKNREKTKTQLLLPLLKFIMISAARIARRHARRPYDLIHVHNVPDFLVFVALLPKLTGAKVILDIHDIVPEFYANKFHLAPAGLGVRMLRMVEKASASFANHVIIANHLWHEKFIARSVPAHKCTVLINYVNGKVFRRQEPAVKNGKTIILFPGGLQWHQGLDIAIRAMPAVAKRIPGVEFHIYGDGNIKEELVILARGLGLGETVRFFDPLPVTEIAKVMAGADLGVVPKRADSFGNEAYSTKIMEFMLLGVPVVVSSTKIDRYYFDDTVVRFFESGNPTALAEAAVEVLGNKELRGRLIGAGSEYAARNNWEARKVDYLQLVDKLLTPGRNGAVANIVPGSAEL